MQQQSKGECPYATLSRQELVSHSVADLVIKIRRPGRIEKTFAPPTQPNHNAFMSHIFNRVRLGTFQTVH